MKADKYGKLTTLNLHIKLLTDVLESLEPINLLVAPIQTVGSFGKQFRHILDIRECYRDAIETNVLDFIRTDIDHSLEDNKEGFC